MPAAGALIPVVAAVVLRARRVLLCQRPEGPHLPLLWEFPGGKVGPGETAAAALARELREELGVAARIGPHLLEVRHAYPDKRVWLRFYAAAIAGSPEARVHRSLRWVPVEELARYPVPPANRPMIDRLLTDGAAVAAAMPLPPGGRAGTRPASRPPRA